MGVRTWNLLLAALTCAALVVPSHAAGQAGRGRGQATRNQNADVNTYDHGYRDGLQRGELDARSRRPFDTPSFSGSRNDYRVGFADGYRTGYDRQHVRAPYQSRNDGRIQQQQQRVVPRGYQEPAFATGFDSGYEKGIEDGRDGDRYDPVRHKDYRDAERGYRGAYGSRDAYRTNFRTGFRQGYEDGYRVGTRNRR